MKHPVKNFVSFHFTYILGSQPYLQKDNHLINHAANLALTLPGEEVTMLKFNLFLHSTTQLSDKSEEFAAQQYQLIVGSYKTSSTDGNGGVLRFYKFDQATGTLTLDKEYEGFARIKNVMYRER